MRDAPRGDRGALQVTAGQVVAASVSRESDMTPRLRLVRSARQPEPDSAAAEVYLSQLIRRGQDVGEIPILGSPEWCDLDRSDPRSIAAVAVSALAWFLEKHDPDRLRQRLADDDLLVRSRLRHMIGDLAEVPWSRLHEVARARAEAGDYRYRKGARDG